MAYILLDESGDLGFDFTKKKTSKYFVITLVLTNDLRKLQKISKKVFKSVISNKKKSTKKHSGILHAYKEKPKTRIKFLSEIASADITIFAIYLNKKKVYTDLVSQVNVLYNFVTNILLDRIYSKKLIPLNEKITLIASQKDTNAILNKNFKSYLTRQVESNHELSISIEIKSGNQEKALQTSDFVSWSIFRKIEHLDESYYEIISKKVMELRPLFP